MNIEFDKNPDTTGMGRIIVDGKFYGLPAEVVKMFADMTETIVELDALIKSGRKIDD